MSTTSHILCPSTASIYPITNPTTPTVSIPPAKQLSSNGYSKTPATLSRYKPGGQKSTKTKNCYTFPMLLTLTSKLSSFGTGRGCLSKGLKRAYSTNGSRSSPTSISCRSLSWTATSKRAHSSFKAPPPNSTSKSATSSLANSKPTPPSSTASTRKRSTLLKLCFSCRGPRISIRTALWMCGWATAKTRSTSWTTWTTSRAN